MPQRQKPPRNQLAWQARLVGRELASEITMIGSSDEEQLDFAGTPQRTELFLAVMCFDGYF